MRYAAGAALLLLVIAGDQAVGQPRPGRGPVDAEVLVTARDWLHAQFDLPYVRELPAVELVPPERLVAIRSGVPPLPRSTAGRTRERPDLVALYVDAERTMYLPLGWSGTTQVALTVVLHELVPHIQNVAGLTYPCSGAREAPAFAAQAAWLARSGRDLETAFGIDALTLKVRTSCLY
jgi:hypothetical protein